jgi:hypothetical protein
MNTRFSFKVTMSKRTVEKSTFTVMVPFHSDEKVNESYFDEAWAANTVSSSNPVQASHVYNSFMNQEWNALPEGVTPNDIIRDIIDMFGTM